MKWLSILLLLVSTQGNSWANGSSRLRIELQLSKSAFILGEPIKGLVTLENVSKLPVTYAFALSPYSSTAALRIDGPVQVGCKAEKKFVEIGAPIGPPPQLVPGEKKTLLPICLQDWGIVAEGNYEVWIEYDSQKPEEGVVGSSLSPLRTESAHVRFNVARPTGIDAEILRKHPNKCNQVALAPEELLRCYPTSTYAVYALAEFYGLNGFTPPLETERERVYLAKLQKTGRDSLADRRHFATNAAGKEIKDSEGKPVTITTEEWLRKCVEQAEQICAAHPEMPISEHIRYNVIGSYYVDLLQFQNAAKVFEKLHDSAVDPQIKENSGKMLQILKDAGLVAN